MRKTHSIQFNMSLFDESEVVKSSIVSVQPLNMSSPSNLSLVPPSRCHSMPRYTEILSLASITHSFYHPLHPKLEHLGAYALNIAGTNGQRTGYA